MRTSVLLALLLASTAASAAEQTRALPAFNSIRCEGPVNIVVEVGKTQALEITGDSKFVSKVETRVVGGELRVTMEEEEEGKHINMRDSDKIVVSLPALTAFRVKGAGQAILNNVDGERLELRFLGAGRLAANGKVRHLNLSATGVGEVDTQALKAQSADVNFEGIGGVKVYAKERLDAYVKGMGSLEYYGNPATVKKTVIGIGNVTARE
jgi:hypothetical protein